MNYITVQKDCQSISKGKSGKNLTSCRRHGVSRTNPVTGHGVNSNQIHLQALVQHDFPCNPSSVFIE